MLRIIYPKEYLFNFLIIKTHTMRIILFVCMLLIAELSIAQDTTRRTNRGDRNTSISTSSRTNVPRNQRTPLTQSKYRIEDPVNGSDKPDVLLDIPSLNVDSITLSVDTLSAHLSLDARVANLVTLKAGVDLGINKVKLGVYGVQASALLIVRLDNVRSIIEKTLALLDNNPQIIDKLLTTVDSTVSKTLNTVGNVANTALQPGGLLSQTVNTLGQTVQRTIDATGNIVERTLDNSGKLLSSNNVGRLLDLPVISQTRNSAGQLVKRVRDTSGTLIEVIVDNAGKFISSKVVQ